VVVLSSLCRSQEENSTVKLWTSSPQYYTTASLLTAQERHCFGDLHAMMNQSSHFVMAMDAVNCRTKRVLSSRSRSCCGGSPRKRVRFDQQGSEGEADVAVHILATIRASSDMSPSEIDAMWNQKGLLRRNIQNAREIAVEEQNRRQYLPEDCKEMDYAGAIESSFVACCLDPVENSALPEECAGYLTHASQSRKGACSSEDSECLRGLEKVVVPLFGMETSRRRKEAISHVILAQHALQGIASSRHRSELLREISEAHSRPSRKFAKALGGVDAMSALHAYQESQNPDVGARVRVAALVA
jgi:hypothetical protein